MAAFYYIVSHLHLTLNGFYVVISYILFNNILFSLQVFYCLLILLPRRYLPDFQSDLYRVENRAR